MLKGNAAPELLAIYQAERHPVGWLAAEQSLTGQRRRCLRKRWAEAPRILWRNRAWCEGKLVQAQEHGHAALQLWEKTSLVYPFHWLALWPLIAVALAQGRCSEHQTIRSIRSMKATCISPKAETSMCVSFCRVDSKA